MSLFLAERTTASRIVDPFSLAVDARALRPPLSGVGRYTLSMLRALAALPDGPRLACAVNDREVWNCHRWPGHARSIVSPANLESHPVGDLLWHSGIGATLRREGVTPRVFWGPAFQLPGGKRPWRSVVTIHDLAAFLHPETMPPKFAWYIRQLVRRSIRNADAIVAVSRAVRHNLIEALGVGADRIHVIGEGPLLGVTQGVSAEAPPAALPDPDRPFFLFAGALEPRKNLLFLLRAFERFHQAGGAERLVICGPPGWRNAPIVDALERSPAASGIVRLRFVPDAELRWLYRNARALLLPSLDEGFGLPALEAAAMGTLPLVSDRGALPEIAPDPACVLPLREEAWVEAMRRLPEVASEALLAHAARHSWEDAAAKFDRLARSLAS